MIDQYVDARVIILHTVDQILHTNFFGNIFDVGFGAPTFCVDFIHHLLDVDGGDIISRDDRAVCGEGERASSAVEAVRKSYENPAVAQTYAEFLTDGPCGHKSHKLLHTEYTARGKHIPQD
jgi:hypothetical protein